MKKLCLIAALLLASTSADAGSSYSFRINGQSVRIDVPRNCAALSCINIHAPGLKFSEPEADEEPAKGGAQASSEPAPSAVPAPTWNAKPGEGSAPSVSAPAAPAAAPASPARVSTLPSDEPAPAAEPTAPAKPAATAVASAPAPQAEAPKPAGPLGTWMTEKKEGLVRIEPCGANICGYSVNQKTNQNGDKVLIDMRPAGTDKWKGRIKDTRNGGGGVYDSTIALKGDKLRVTGCAFGGMFCGGQTWTRAN